MTTCNLHFINKMRSTSSSRFHGFWIIDVAAHVCMHVSGNDKPMFRSLYTSATDIFAFYVVDVWDGLYLFLAMLFYHLLILLWFYMLIFVIINLLLRMNVSVFFGLSFGVAGIPLIWCFCFAFNLWNFEKFWPAKPFDLSDVEKTHHFPFSPSSHLHFF